MIFQVFFWAMFESPDKMAAGRGLYENPNKVGLAELKKNLHRPFLPKHAS